MIRKILTIFFVADQDAAEAFYRAALDMEPILSVPGMTEFELLDGTILGLMPEEGKKRLLAGVLPEAGRPAGIPRAELYLLVDDPHAGHDRALAAGARELSPLQPRPWGDQAAYCLDPDGHILVFAQTLPDQSATEEVQR